MTLCGVLHLQEGVGAGRFAVGEGGDGHRGDHGPPLTLLHLHPHLLQQLVIQSVSDVKLSVWGGEIQREKLKILKDTHFMLDCEKWLFLSLGSAHQLM